MSFYKELEKTKVLFLTREPFYSCLLNRFNLVLTKVIPTMGVSIKKDGSLIMYINKEFFMNMTDDQRIAVFIHELLHVMNGHLTRGKNLKTKTSNVAMDCAINQWIRNLPDNTVTLNSLSEYVGHPLDSKREFEYYYNCLMQATDQKGVPADQWEDFDDHSGFDDSEVSEEIKRSIKDNAVNGAYKEYKKRNSQSGSHHFQLDAYLEQYKKNSANWKDTLKRYVAKALSSEREPTRKKPNRRMGYNVPGNKTLYKVKPVLALDQSGSTTDEDQVSFMQNVGSILGEFQDSLDIVYFDTEIAKVVQANKVTQEVNARYANGGTDFQCVVDYANKVGADLLIVFTDGFASMPSNVRSPIIWALTGEDNSDLKGEKVFIDRKKVS